MTPHPFAPTPIDADAAWRALVARDGAADGRFFVGVTSTGVYCRPICRVRTPRRERCRFFATAAQAEAASFRPCLKCRPELAPGAGFAWSVMDASRTLARQAAQRLDGEAHGAEAPERAVVAALARRLGVSERHLRRIFVAEHGVTPRQYVQTRRLLLAKQLLTDTPLPVTEVALASGFRSVRRFNAVFAASYRMSPTRLRRHAEARPAAPCEAVSVQLGVREPLDRAALLGRLAEHAVPGVEQVDADAGVVRRTLRPGVVGAAGGWLEAAFVPERAVVRLSYDARLAPHSGALLRAVRRWLDLDADAQAIGAHGPRPPGCLDAFEAAVRAVLGRRATPAAARLVERWGEPVQTPWSADARWFPSPAALAAATVDDVAALGVAPSHAAALLRLAREWPGRARASIVLPTDPDGVTFQEQTA